MPASSPASTRPPPPSADAAAAEDDEPAAGPLTIAVDVAEAEPGNGSPPMAESAAA